MLMAASMGDVAQTMSLLQERVPLEPRDGYSGPLHLALTRGQRDVMMLLLAGGAPITATSSDGLTILEAAHRTPDLPALFPAVIREVSLYYDIHYRKSVKYSSITFLTSEEFFSFAFLHVS